MSDVNFISLIQLIQHPGQYHQQVVRVIGVARMAFEAKAVYVTREDQEKAVTKNAVWVSAELNDANKNLDGKYVLVEGTFDKDNLGHLKLYSGAIVQIQRLEEWKS